jgi:hypothetical protein
MLRPFRAGPILTHDPGRCPGLVCFRTLCAPRVARKVTLQVFDRLPPRGQCPSSLIEAATLIQSFTCSCSPLIVQVKVNVQDQGIRLVW